MKEPLFNGYFPLSEYEQRIKKIRLALRKAGLDAILLAGHHNVEYASGLLHGTWMHGFGEGSVCVLISALEGDEPILIMQEGLRGCSDTSALSDIRIIKWFISPEGAQAVSNAFIGKGLARCRVGIENNLTERMGFTAPFWDMVMKLLPDVKWSDATEIMYGVRKVKSPLEIAKVRKAVEVTSQAYAAALPCVREGMSEKELAGIIASEMAGNCDDACVINPWFIFVHADGKNPIAWDGVPSDYRFKKHDFLYVDCGFCYQGYSADFIRVVSIGEPDLVKARIYNSAREANMALIEQIKPGIKCCDLYEILNRKISELGFAKEARAMREYGFIYEGHGIGLSIHEPPIIEPSSEEIIEVGMTMSIEGNIFTSLPFSKETIALKNEENILVTESGCEILSKLSNDIWISNH